MRAPCTWRLVKMSRPERKQVFEAHVTAGWIVSCVEGRAAPGDGSQARKKQKAAQRIYSIRPPASACSSPRTDLRPQLEAYGLDTPADACKLWGAAGDPAQPGLCKDPGQRKLGMLLRTLMGAISATRLSAAVLLSNHWCKAALQVVAVALRELHEFVQGPWHNSASRITQRAASTLLTSLDSGLATCLDWSARCGPALSPEAAVLVTTGCDAMYYALLDHHLTAGCATPAVPPPHLYFPAMAAAHPGNAEACQRLLQGPAGAEACHLLQTTWGLKKGEGGVLQLPPGTASSNPLMATMWARWQEGCRLLWSSGLGTAGEMDALVYRPPHIKGKGKGKGRSKTKASSSGLEPEPWPAHPALLAWRKSGRECHMYAFAAPNRSALEALSARQPLLEVGAGTGYWASLLRQHGADVMAYDVAPPSASAAGGANEYHGYTPGFTEVLKGGPEVAATAAAASRTLFLCYPPFGASMAAECLRQYRGKCVCVIGEWDGDTGTPAFTSGLLRDWVLVQRVAMPNWTDTSHELTVWERRSSSGHQHSEPAAQGLPLLQCACCGKHHACAGQPKQSKSGAGGQQTEAVKLKRCRFCREAAYCSAACELQDSDRHAGLHALRLVFHKRSLCFDKESDYAAVNV